MTKQIHTPEPSFDYRANELGNYIDRTIATIRADKSIRADQILPLLGDVRFFIKGVRADLAGIADPSVVAGLKEAILEMLRCDHPDNGVCRSCRSIARTAIAAMEPRHE